jgi:hypothetical protein
MGISMSTPSFSGGYDGLFSQSMSQNFNARMSQFATGVRATGELLIPLV